MTDQLINLVIALREAQRADIEKRTRGTMKEREQCELCVDNWIQNYFAEKIRLDFWTRSVKGSEEPAPYNVRHESEEEKNKGA